MGVRATAFQLIIAAVVLLSVCRGFLQAGTQGFSSSARHCGGMQALKGLFGGGGDAEDKTLFDFTVQDSQGNDVALSKYQGKKKAFIITNVATKWGLTAQNYKEFVEVYEAYSSQGLEILGFPCNQFGGQEPGTNAEIQAFAKSKGAKFPIFAKIEVNGDGADPLWKWLKSAKGGTLGLDAIKWNFSKFIVDKDGNPRYRHAPTDSPQSLTKEIEELLAE